jgi:hypothetical protein
MWVIFAFIISVCIHTITPRITIMPTPILVPTSHPTVEPTYYIEPSNYPTRICILVSTS